MEQQKQQTNNYVINRIDTALEAEEFKHMRNMLEPLNNVSIQANASHSLNIALTAIIFNRLNANSYLFCLLAVMESRTAKGSSPR